MSDQNIVPPQNIPPQPIQPTQAPVQQNVAVQPQPAADPLLTNKVHDEDLDAQWTSWKCLVCNFVYEGQVPKNQCPRCNNDDPDKFD